MNKQRPKMNDHFPLVTIAVLSVVLLAGCSSTGPGGPARAQTDVSGGQVSVKSPDGTIEMTIRGNGPVIYSASVDGTAVLADSRLGLKFKDGVTLGANARLTKVERNQSDTTWKNKLGKRQTVRDRHNRTAGELTLHLARAGGAVASFEPVSRR
jgi:hypothetical protein